ncbi:hypothetical protein ABMK53_001845 [Yersinia enterocolitica]|nr:hypothetical protein [Yersinia enterocolitica]MBX9479084.1 hypothetical protein [Yersinia enterocolitica]
MVEATDTKQLALARIQLIADISQAAQCSTSEFLIAMALISDLAKQVVSGCDSEDMFYCAEEQERH